MSKQMDLKHQHILASWHWGLDDVSKEQIRLKQQHQQLVTTLEELQHSVRISENRQNDCCIIFNVSTLSYD